MVYLSLLQLKLHKKFKFHYFLTTRQQVKFLHDSLVSLGRFRTGRGGENSRGPSPGEAGRPLRPGGVGGGGKTGATPPQPTLGVYATRDPRPAPRPATRPSVSESDGRGMLCDRFHVSPRPPPALLLPPSPASLSPCPQPRTKPAREVHPRDPYRKLWSPFCHTECTESQQLPRADPSFPSADRKAG